MNFGSMHLDRVPWLIVGPLAAIVLFALLVALDTWRARTQRIFVVNIGASFAELLVLLAMICAVFVSTAVFNYKHFSFVSSLAAVQGLQAWNIMSRRGNWTEESCNLAVALALGIGINLIVAKMCKWYISLSFVTLQFSILGFMAPIRTPLSISSGVVSLIVGLIILSFGIQRTGTPASISGVVGPGGFISGTVHSGAEGNAKTTHQFAVGYGARLLGWLLFLAGLSQIVHLFV
jgi:hypothetical protein